jgi:hypothetical protein
MRLRAHPILFVLALAVFAWLFLGCGAHASSYLYAMPSATSEPDAPSTSASGSDDSAAFHDYWSPSYPYARARGGGPGGTSSAQGSR